VEWRYYLNNPMEILGTLRSAGVLIGGVAIGAAVFVLYCRRHGLPTLALADAIVAPLAVAQAVGRLGCFSAGCCYGTPSDGSLAVTFTQAVAAAQTGVPLNIPLFPTQLTEMSVDLLLAILLTWMWRKRISPPGTVLWTYVLSYACLRFLIEFLRGDTVRGLWIGGVLSTSQILAVLAGLAAAVMLLRGRKRRAPESQNG
jgi:phosphatidylglycerol:prolipoprotein diacylglycerol transferase